MKQPELIVVGGANGSGKTTFARELVAERGLKYLGADEIAVELNPTHPEKVSIQAARIFSQRLSEYLERGESFILESTLSGLSLKKSLVKVREKNFTISVFFVYLDSVDLCISRIATRVAKGGHYVPNDDVRRRFSRANRNFWHDYKELADDWFLFFNAVDSFEQIADGDKNGRTIIDEKRFEKWLEMLK